MTPSVTDPSTRLGAGPDQARTIARATFNGFLQTDLMPSGMQAPAIIWAASFMMMPTVFMAAQSLSKYPMIRRFHPEMLEPTLWGDRLLFLILSAGGIGLVSVVLWDTLFPARRDAFVLTPLPVPLPVQMFGRLLGLGTLAGIFVLLLNVLPALSFPIVSAQFAIEMPVFIVAHMVAATAADAFVFFSVTALQGVVILALGRGAAAKLATLAQTGAVLVVLLTLMFVGGVQYVTRNAIVGGDLSDPALMWNPAAWFLGLYEYIAGSPRDVMPALALRAVMAAMVPMAITVAIYAFGYQRLLARAVETPSRATRSLVTRLTSGLVRRLFVWRPQEQAICSFMLRAIVRNGRHNMMMSIYIGGALALMITFVLPDLLRFGPSGFATPTVSVLALPLLLSVGLAVGGRILITIPADMPARWIFMTSAITARHADAAAHKGLLLLVLPPVIATAALSAAGLWGARVAALHVIYCTALSLLLCEVLLIRYHSLPMTRPYIPGASRFHTLWGLYMIIFTTYTLTSARLERDLLRYGGTQSVLIAAGIFSGLALVIWARRKFKLWNVVEIPFEAETPEDQMFQGFNLSEIHAAQAVASPANAVPSKRV